MPRVSLNKKKYKLKDLPEWIAGKLFSMGLHHKDAAEWIGLSPPAFCIRMKNGMFSYEEMLTLFDQLHATDEEILRIMKL